MLKSNRTHCICFGTYLLDNTNSFICRPTTTEEKIERHTDYEYYAAHKLGTEIKGRCNDFFPDCKANFVEMFSKVRDV